jgi:hypothetical protein
MDRITLDGNIVNQLHGLKHVVDLCDPSGRLLGQFVPVDDDASVVDLTGWEEITPPVSEEELDRRELETESYSTDEMLAYLESLRCSESDGNGPP